MSNDLVRKQLDEWAKALIDLSRRNRLLYFRHLKSASLSFAQDSRVVEERLERERGGWYFFLPPNPPTDSSEPYEPGAPRDDELVINMQPQRYGPTIERGLANLFKKKQSVSLDTGLWVLYLGFGMLKWNDNGEQARSPLLLVPVDLEQKNGVRWHLSRYKDGESALNPALDIKFKKDFGIDLPTLDQLEDTSISSVAEVVANKVADIDALVEEDETVLTTFFFHKEVIYRDLKQNADNITHHPIVRLLAEGPNREKKEYDFDFSLVPDYRLDQEHPPEEMACILDTDVTQRQCLIAARQGHSFVMDGPPGTGKSQTIANMIAQLISDDKTVLFVSEKAAALEVVQNRLYERGLHDFILALHSRTASRKEVAQELGRVLRERPKAEEQFNMTKLAQLQETRNKLSDYALAINLLRQPFERSLHYAIGRILQIRSENDISVDIVVPKVDTSNLNSASFWRLCDYAKQLSKSWGPVDRDDFLWRDLKDPDSMVIRQGEMRSLIDNCLDKLKQLKAQVTDACYQLRLSVRETPLLVPDLIDLLRLLKRGYPVGVSWLISEPPEYDQIVTDVQNLSSLLSSRHCFEQVNHSWNQLSLIPEITRGSITNKMLKEMSELVQEAKELATTIIDPANDLIRLFGFETTIDLGTLDLLIELCRLFDSSTPPEPAWFDPAVSWSLEQGVQTLHEQVISYQASYQNLKFVFTEQVLDLDLLALKARFAEVRKGIKRFRKQYRADKRQLAKVAWAGQYTKEILPRIDEAIEWQEQNTGLKQTKEQYASLFGRYWSDNLHNIDIEDIRCAHNITKEILALAAGKVSYSGLAQYIETASEQRVQTSYMSLLNLAEKLARLFLLAKRIGIQKENMARILITDIHGSLSLLDSVIREQKVLLDEIDTITDSEITIDLAEQSVNKKVNEVIQRISIPLGRVITDDSLDPDYLQGVSAWVDQVRTKLRGSISTQTAELLLTTELEPDILNEYLEYFRVAIDKFVTVFKSDYRDELKHDIMSSFFDNIHKDLVHFKNTIGDLVEWQSFDEAYQALKKAGWIEVVEECIDQRVSNKQVALLIEGSILQRWVQQMFAQCLDKKLRPLRSVIRDSLQRDFRVLDQELIADTAARVINKCAARLPRSPIGEVGIILRQAELKKRHKPVRKLLEEAGQAAQQIKPCFMMSPLSISQFLPEGLSFDVVIFDEASQVREADAICAIARGDQLIVAGDQKQLPPTNFFQRISDRDEETNEDILDFESILDRCKAHIKSLSLLWHYRSRHESLITFSNFSFYKGRLHTFPGALYDSTDLGVELFKVDGTYRRGGTRDNKEEAQAVVDRVVYHLKKHPDLTIGVVALSEAQQSTIEATIEQRSREIPKLRSLSTGDRLGGFFVKNLENVQGDERDIIILSIGYGPDEYDKFLMNFGPMNRLGGERRLNVAVTRARYRVEVVCSFAPGMIRTNNPTIGYLAKYLDYADRGVSALALDPSSDEEDNVESPFEEEVLQVVRKIGYEATAQVGAAGYRIDIGIRHPSEPGRYLLGIECDGASYHSSKEARSRDRIRQEVLEGLGWRIYRIWSTAWFTDRKGEERRLQKEIEQALKGHQAEDISIPKQLNKDITVEIEEFDFDSLPDWVHCYTEPVLDQVEESDLDFTRWGNRHLIISQIMKVVVESGPIHEERVLEIVRNAWRINKSSPRIRSTFRDIVQIIINRKDIIKVFNYFLAKPGYEILVRSCKQDASCIQDDVECFSKRKMEHVFPDEISLAITNLLLDAGGRVQIEQLYRKLIKVFGLNRLGRNIRNIFDQTVDRLVDNALIVIDNRESICLAQSDRSEEEDHHGNLFD